MTIVRSGHNSLRLLATLSGRGVEPGESGCASWSGATGSPARRRWARAVGLVRGAIRGPTGVNRIRIRRELAPAAIGPGQVRPASILASSAGGEAQVNVERSAGRRGRTTCAAIVGDEVGPRLVSVDTEPCPLAIEGCPGASLCHSGLSESASPQVKRVRADRVGSIAAADLRVTLLLVSRRDVPMKNACPGHSPATGQTLGVNGQLALAVGGGPSTGGFNWPHLDEADLSAVMHHYYGAEVATPLRSYERAFIAQVGGAAFAYGTWGWRKPAGQLELRQARYRSRYWWRSWPSAVRRLHRCG